MEEGIGATMHLRYKRGHMYDNHTELGAQRHKGYQTIKLLLELGELGTRAQGVIDEKPWDKRYVAPWEEDAPMTVVWN